jgi:hypothetical protein
VSVGGLTLQSSGEEWGIVEVRNYGVTLVEGVSVVVECYGETEEGAGEHVLTGSWAGPVVPADLLPGDFATAEFEIIWEPDMPGYDQYVHGGFPCGYKHTGIEVRILAGGAEVPSD